MEAEENLKNPAFILKSSHPLKSSSEAHIVRTLCTSVPGRNCPSDSNMVPIPKAQGTVDGVTETGQVATAYALS